MRVIPPVAYWCVSLLRCSLLRLIFLLLLSSWLLGCTAQPQQPEAAEWDEEEWEANPRDPYENWNRRVFVFNESVDAWIFKPAAQGYKAVTPELVRTGVRNFFHNLREVSHLTNNLLQGKPLDAGRDATRLGLNSTLGLFGVLDVATPLGLRRSEEDFGQTLNVWGVPEGPYLVWPFLGGQNLSHTLALPVEYFLSPQAYLEPAEAGYAAWALQAVQLRTDLLDVEELISGDRYSFIRDAYLQRRSYLIVDGVMESDPFLDDDFDDNDFDDAFAD